MKKHVKILSTLGLTMPLALTSLQASNVSTSPFGIHKERTLVETDESCQNMVLNRISDFSVDNQCCYALDHTNVHTDYDKYTDTHTDITRADGGHTDKHTDSRGHHVDKHTDKD